MFRIRPSLIVPRYWPAMGGAEHHARALAHALTAHCEPDIIRVCAEAHRPTDYAYCDSLPVLLDDEGITIRQLAPQSGLRPALKTLADLAPNYRLARGAFQAIAQQSILAHLRKATATSDLVHVIYNGFTPLAKAAASLGKPFVFTPLAHTTRPEGTAWSSPRFKRLYKRADAIIAMTEYERDWLIDHGAMASKTHVVPMAALLDESTIVDPNGFRSKHGIWAAPMVLFLGRLVEYKGYRALLRAMEQVWQQHPSVRFVFAGPGEHEAKQNALAYRNDPRVIFTGALSDQDKQSALAACSMLCVPSTEESLGVVYLEAWHHEKPVIAADIPVMRSVIDDGGDGLLVEPGALSLANEINMLLGFPEMAKTLGKAGAAKAKSGYSWAGSAKALSKVYQTVLNLEPCSAVKLGRPTVPLTING